MKLRIWSKTMLSVYNYIPKLTESIDKIVEKFASSNLNSNDVFFNITDRILTLTQKKIDLINLKVLCDEILKKMKNSEAEILVLRYIDNMSIEDICKIKKTSRRTIFRRISLGISNFQNILLAFGYNSEKLYYLYNSQGWIINKYNSILKSEENIAINSCKESLFTFSCPQEECFCYIVP